MFGFEELFDLNKDGKLDSLENASLYTFLLESERNTSKRTFGTCDRRSADDDIFNEEEKDY